jgi:hypothetical protein
LFLRPLAYLCGTRALLQRLTAMAIRRSKRRTSALRSARERERERKKKRETASKYAGGGDGGPRSAFTWSRPNLPGWPSPLVFTWTWPRTYVCG